MRNFIQFEYEDATCLTIRLKDETVERIDDALAGGTLRLRTRQGFAVAAILWALGNLRADQELTIMGLEGVDQR